MLQERGDAERQKVVVTSPHANYVVQFGITWLTFADTNHPIKIVAIHER